MAPGKSDQAEKTGSENWHHVSHAEQKRHDMKPDLHASAPVRRRGGLRCRHFMILIVLAFSCFFALLRGSVWLGGTPVGGQADAHYLASDDSFHQGVYGGSRGRHLVGQHALPDRKGAKTQGKVPKTDTADQYLLGVGKADITGPIVEINMMGYADRRQVGSGVRQRLYSRAFIVGNVNKPADRFIYLVLDTQCGDTAVRYGILSGLKQMGPAYSMYGQNNLAVTGTHSHSGPGAWLNYLLPQITSKGFDRQSYRAIVDGCLLSIRRAHESLSPGYLSAGQTKITGASINRSLFAYLGNPQEERARYNVSEEDDGSVDQEMTMLSFQRAADNKNIGALTWFPTHGTSMLANNTLITGDNKGVAADLFEKQVRGGKLESDNFVAGFSQANMGDASPNTLGAWCEDGSGDMCSFKDSACSDGKSRHCRARGPGFRVKDGGATSCFEIGKRQYEGAMRIYESLANNPPNIRGTGVKAIHKFHDMAFSPVTLANGSTARTCPAALGYSFAAGTWDEPGVFSITQHGSNPSNTSPFWKVISWLLKTPSKDQVVCQYPKPILLDVGEVTMPYQWTPNIVDVQTFRVGQFFIVVSPGEATTMAGRRWKEAVAERSKSTLSNELGEEEPIVVIGAPSNSYTHYITTEEEYGIQRYEGASTLYGPHTLAAYIDQTLASLHLLRNIDTTARSGYKEGPLPPDNSNRSISLISGVLYDGTPWLRHFGETKIDVVKNSFVWGEIARATFVGANPRNNLRLEKTFAAVERREGPQGPWEVVRDDSDWGLIFRWTRTSDILGSSEVEIAWEIEEWTPPGEYRLRYFGDSKALGGRVSAFEGASDSFSII